VGTMSYTEKEKGQASDSFKRACFNWGIGRELYTAPFIWLPPDMAEITRKGDKFYTNERFKVGSIGYGKDKEITALTILNAAGRQVYAYGRKTEGKAPVKGPEKDQKAALERELKRTGVALEAVLERYHIQEVGEMTPEMYKNAISGLKKSRSKAA